MCALSALLSNFDVNSSTARLRASSELPWLLTALERLWNVLYPLRLQMSSWKLAGPLLAVFLDSIRRYLSCASKSDLDSFAMPKVLDILSRVTKTLCSAAKPLVLQLSLQKPLSLILLEVATHCQRSPNFSLICSEYFLPALVNIKQLSNAPKDLMVSLACLCQSMKLLTFRSPPQH